MLARMPRLPLVLAAALSIVAAVPTLGDDDMTGLSLEALMDQPVYGASKYEQKQTEVAAAVSVITRQDIRTFGWRTLDEALASLPGIHLTNDRQYTYIGTRGFGLPGDYNTRVLVAIDGNRVNEPTYDAGPMGRQLPLDMGLVERIEFLPGPGGAVYGQNAMFGVVNIITRTGADVDGVEFAAAYQSPQGTRDGRASWGQRFANGIDVLLAASFMHSRGENRFFEFGDSGISGTARRLDTEDDKELFASATRDAWSAEIVYGDRSKGDPTGAYRSDPLARGQYQDDRYALAQLQYQDALRDGTLQLSGRIFGGQQRYRSRLDYGDSISFPATSEWRGAELRLVSTALTEHKLLLGLEGQDNARIDQSVLSEADPSNNIAIRGSGYRVGLYAQDEWQFAGAWALTLGMRVDRNDTAGTDVSPRAALIWQANAATTLKALYGRAHRAPNAFEHDYADNVAQVANSALGGETIDTLELVADYSAAPDLHVHASLYHWRMRGLITLGNDPDSGLTQYQSGGTVDARGVEVAVDKTWDWGGRLRSSLSYQQPRAEHGKQLVNSPALLGKLNFSTALPIAGLRMAYELRYDSARRTLAGRHLDGYPLSNLRLDATGWIDGLELSLQARNLFDQHYAQPAADSNWQDALAQDGRSVMLEAQFRH